MLTLNQVLQFDPTRTLTLRRNFTRDMSKRFRILKGDIRTSIVKNDAFGLRKKSPTIFTPAASGEFAFTSTPEKVDAFLSWLNEQQNDGLLEIIKRPGAVLRQGIEEPWTNIYIRPAYEKGALSGAQKLKQAGIEVRLGDDGLTRIAGVFDQPVHADRAGAIYTRTFTDLKGITALTSVSMARVLIDGILRGGSPEFLAQQITSKIDTIGLNRARTLVRTEIVRAHHLATVQEYRNAGLNEVIVLAEFSTAGDDRVCPECAALEGRIFTLDEIEGLIPVHPGCRCTTLPVVPGIEANKMIANYLRAHGIKRQVRIHT